MIFHGNTWATRGTGPTHQPAKQVDELQAPPDTHLEPPTCQPLLWELETHAQEGRKLCPPGLLSRRRKRPRERNARAGT